MLNDRNREILAKTVETDEPVIVFRAQDRYSVEAIQWYIKTLSEDAEVAQEFIKVCREVLQSFNEWQDANPDRVKTPDL